MKVGPTKENRATGVLGVDAAARDEGDDLRFDIHLQAEDQTAFFGYRR
jgi:hypothetical protein